MRNEPDRDDTVDAGPITYGEFLKEQRRRVDIKAILSDLTLRKELLSDASAVISERERKHKGDFAP